MAVGLPSGISETLGEAATVVGDIGSGASAAPLTVMVPGSRGLPERNPGSKRRAGLERGNHNVSLLQVQVAVLERISQVSTSTFQTCPDSDHMSPWSQSSHWSQPRCVSPELMEQAPGQSLCFSPHPCYPVSTQQLCKPSKMSARPAPSLLKLSKNCNLQSTSCHPYHSP